MGGGKLRKGAPMIEARQVWNIIQGHVPKKEWVPSEKVYTIVELYGELDEEDRRAQSPESITPRWKVVVRDVLAKLLREGRVRSRKRPHHN